MKTTRILTLIGIALIGLVMTTQVQAADLKNRKDEKKAVTLTFDKPLLDFVVKAYAEQIDAKDIVRVQKMLEQVDHITVSFNDKDASDYVLRFKPLDEAGLQKWMFNEGYLKSTPEPEAEPATVESWMMDPDYLK